MNAIVGRQHDAVGGVATSVVRDGSAIIRQNQTDLLIISRLELLRVAKRRQKALIICLPQQIDLFGLRSEARCEIRPAAVSISGR